VPPKGPASERRVSGLSVGAQRSILVSYVGLSGAALKDPKAGRKQPTGTKNKNERREVENQPRSH
jgi:hypothetical protein